MNNKFIKEAFDFIEKRTTPSKFVDKYIELIQKEKKNPNKEERIKNLSSIVTTIFILCDMYNEDEDRDNVELDENGLRNAIYSLLIVNKILDGEICYEDVPEDTINVIESYR